jgi:hypothetical protein
VTDTNIQAISRLVARFSELPEHHQEWHATYKDYRNSPRWKLFVRRVHTAFGDKCWVCGSWDDLHVHHMVYPERPFEERLNEEDLKKGDVVLLCRVHHRALHDTGLNKWPYTEPQEMRNIQADLLRNMQYDEERWNAHDE